jgi:hypothetical protein
MVTADSLEVESHGRLKMFDGHAVFTLSPDVEHVPPFGVQLLQRHTGTFISQL